MIGLFRDKEGKIPYDIGKGKNLIEICEFYENGELKEIKVSDIFLIVKNEYKDVSIGVVVNKGDVLISIDNNKYDKEIYLGDIKDKIYKVYVKINSKDYDFSFYIKSTKLN